MRYLTIEQREKLEAALNARAAQLRASIAEALDAEGDGGRSLPYHMQETDDEAVADMETSMDVAHLSRDVLDLRATERALSLLHTPDFGTCTDCGIDISFARLNANPLASRCMACQAAYERSLATHSGAGR